MNEARFTPANTDGDPTHAKVLNPSLKTPERPIARRSSGRTRR